MCASFKKIKPRPEKESGLTSRAHGNEAAFPYRSGPGHIVNNLTQNSGFQVGAARKVVATIWPGVGSGNIRWPWW